MPARSRVPSKLPKKKSLSFFNGPPKVPPKMLKIDLALPLLDGFYALNPNFDQENVTVLKLTAANQLRSIVSALGYSGAQAQIK